MEGVVHPINLSILSFILWREGQREHRETSWSCVEWGMDYGTNGVLLSNYMRSGVADTGIYYIAHTKAVIPLSSDWAQRGY